MPKKVLTTPDPPATLTAPVDEVQLSRLISKHINQRGHFLVGRVGFESMNSATTAR